MNDLMYLLMLLIPLAAQIYVSFTYRKYKSAFCIGSTKSTSIF